ncbi:MAG TPA: hypothetical protein VN939_02935 [Chthoniobacterales bacterium]|jgi:hypothetical protein|nr:hypothetical protein [Chthoniobacterales bacterium]
MAKLERTVLAEFPELNERAIEGLIRLEERYKIKADLGRYKASLIDRTKSETQPQCSIFEDEDLQFRAQCHADLGVDLGIHATEDAVIARCQAHHDSTVLL